MGEPYPVVNPNAECRGPTANDGELCYRHCAPSTKCKIAALEAEVRELRGERQHIFNEVSKSMDELADRMHTPGWDRLKNLLAALSRKGRE